MKLKWKIFRAANIVEIILVTIIAGISVYTSTSSFANSYKFLAFLFINFLCAAVIANGFNNISLVNHLKAGDKLGYKKKVWFWVLFGVVSITVVLLSIGFVELYLNYKKQLTDKTQTQSLGQMITTIWGTAIEINACLILYLQVVLFYEIRKQAYETESLLVNTIGISDEA